MDLLLITVILVALFFDFTNGFHDTANSIATSVSTRAVSPRNAVLMAAVLNFLVATTRNLNRTTSADSAFPVKLTGISRE